MLEKIKKVLGLLPKAETEQKLQIQVGIVNGKMHIQINRKVDVIVFNKEQLQQFLGAVACQAAGVK